MDWPYDDDPEITTEPAPVWQCPDEICQCHEVVSAEEEHEFSVMLLSPTGERMAGAICRMRYQGRVINESQPRADGSGWVTAKIPHVPSTVLIEWAPADAPQTPGYPFRARYYVELPGSPREADRRRLHNLGYSRQLSLTDNVKAFQLAYGYEAVTGNLGDITDDLFVYHDDARAPRVDEDDPGTAASAPPAQGPLMNIPSLQKEPNDRMSLVPGASKAKHGPEGKEGAPPQEGDSDGDQKPNKLKPQAPVGKPPSQGGQKVGDGVAQSTRKVPSILQAIDDAKAIADSKKTQASDPTLTPGLFELVMLYSEWNDPADETRTMWGFFWIFADALMWEVPNDATWKDWKGTVVEQPLPRKPYGGVTISDRTRLVRLPCTGKEAQEAVDRLAFSQAELLAFDGSDLASISSSDKVPCLIPTAELYDLSYLQAEVRIGPNSLPISNLTENTLAYAKLVAKAFDDARKQNKTLTGPPKSLGTPGKIWAIADRMDTWVWCEQFCSWAFACINHGFHQGFTHNAKGKAIVNKPIQRQGGCHDWGHADYSQIFSAVAGWCIVKAIDETNGTWQRTEAIYSDKSPKELWRLVRDTSAVPATRYHGLLSNSPARPTAPPPNASQKCIDAFNKRKK